MYLFSDCVGDAKMLRRSYLFDHVIASLCFTMSFQLTPPLTPPLPRLLKK